MPRQDRTPREGGARSSIYDDITSRIIAELEPGRLPWVRPWGTASAMAPLALPRNAATRRQYSGINILIHWGAVVQQGYPRPMPSRNSWPR
jgi:antirestriction protein ArdC